MRIWIIRKDYSDQLTRIERKLDRMSDMEARLDEVLGMVQNTVTQVVDLVGQVIAKIQDAGSEVDLSDETDTLTTLQSDLQGAADRMKSALDTAAAPAEPTGDETTGGTSTMGADVTTEGTEPV